MKVYIVTAKNPVSGRVYETEVFLSPGDAERYAATWCKKNKIDKIDVSEKIAHLPKY